MSENTSIGATIETPRTEVVRSPKVVSRKGRHRMKWLKSLMEQTVAKPKKKRTLPRMLLNLDHGLRYIIRIPHFF